MTDFYRIPMTDALRELFPEEIAIKKDGKTTSYFLKDGIYIAEREDPCVVSILYRDITMEMTEMINRSKLEKDLESEGLDNTGSLN